ncbi:MAG: hypothetical protein IKA91_03225 [Bacteroidaceae bacterium]|nr:hypothetical protein [Bacteroidaceae bacterium]MBR6749533.1 hypothetical protein [Bacteroidaceae bacterium]
MTRKSKKKTKGNRRRRQIRIFKVVITLLVILLPCIWLIGSSQRESEPMRVARTFANHLIHARYNEACAIATPQSVDDVMFYATWMGNQPYDGEDDRIRFKVTHAQLLMPADTVNVVRGKVLVELPDDEERVLHNLELKMLYTLDGWVVDYETPTSMW